MKNKKKTYAISFGVIAFCVIMAFVDGVFRADYFIKSLIKLVLFLGFPLLYAIFDKEFTVKEIFKINKKGVLVSLALGVGVYAVILGGYSLLKGVFDFSNITGTLTQNIGVKKENFLYVSLYISFINSFLEEFFFRGVAFLTLKRVAGRCFSYLFSAGAFALYHVAMMIGWFSWELFLIVMLGLFLGGVIFNYLNEKTGSIYPSWLLHMFANFAINTIGFILFGII